MVVLGLKPMSAGSKPGPLPQKLPHCVMYTRVTRGAGKNGLSEPCWANPRHLTPWVGNGPVYFYFSERVLWLQTFLMAAHSKNHILHHCPVHNREYHICIYPYWINTAELISILKTYRALWCFLCHSILFHVLKSWLWPTKMISWPTNECQPQFANTDPNHSRTQGQTPLAPHCLLWNSEVTKW